jgi:hypothetical protein
MLFFGSEISDRPSCWNGITKSMVVFLAYIIQPVKISGGTLKLRAKNYKTKNYKLRLMAGSLSL